MDRRTIEGVTTVPHYPGLSSKAIRHPEDLQAEETLRAVPGFDVVARKFIEFTVERPQLIALMGNSILVGPRQYATIFRLYQDVVRALDVSPEPQLFVSQNAEVNSYALGEEQPCIVLNTGLLDLLSENEIRTVLAHELGHIKCGHTTLIQMAMWTMNAAAVMGEMTLGIGTLISSGLIMAFYDWRRKAELSCDRAALLATDDTRLVMKTMMKVAGGSQKFGHELNLVEFERQSEQYRHMDTDELNQLYKVLIYNGGQGTMMSHPFPVERLHDLKEWAASQEYEEIKAGNYERKTAESKTPDSEDELFSQEFEQLQKGFADIQSQFNQLWQ